MRIHRLRHHPQIRVRIGSFLCSRSGGGRANSWPLMLRNRHVVPVAGPAPDTQPPDVCTGDPGPLPGWQVSRQSVTGQEQQGGAECRRPRPAPSCRVHAAPGRHDRSARCGTSLLRVGIGDGFHRLLRGRSCTLHHRCGGGRDRAHETSAAVVEPGASLGSLAIARGRADGRTGRRADGRTRASSTSTPRWQPASTTAWRSTSPPYVRCTAIPRFRALYQRMRITSSGLSRPGPS